MDARLAQPLDRAKAPLDWRVFEDAQPGDASRARWLPPIPNLEKER
jgi:hypothetical protein